MNNDNRWSAVYFGSNGKRFEYDFLAGNKREAVRLMEAEGKIIAKAAWSGIKGKLQTMQLYSYGLEEWYVFEQRWIQRN